MSFPSAIRTAATLLAILSAGCATPIAYQVYDPIPVTSPRVQVVIREIHRGTEGGVVTLGVTNLSPDRLESTFGSQVVVQREDGSAVRALSLPEFEALVMFHGPIAMGFEEWSHHRVPVALDPLGSNANIGPNEESLLQVAFRLPAKARWLTLDVSPAFRWRNAEGNYVMQSQPMLVAVELPEVPKTHMPTKDDWRNVHFGIAISSDGL